MSNTIACNASPKTTGARTCAAAASLMFHATMPKRDVQRNTEVLFTHAEAGKMFFESDAKIKLSPSDFLDWAIQYFLDEE